MRKYFFVVLCLATTSVVFGEDNIVPGPVYEAPHIATPVESANQNPPIQVAPQPQYTYPSGIPQAQILPIDRTTVLFHVSVIEVSQNKLRHLGFDRAKLLPTNPSDTSAKKPQQSATDELFGMPGAGSNAGCTILKEDDPYFSVLHAMVKDRIAQVVAQPMIATVPNRPTSFQSGGEIPLPIAPGNSNQIEYKAYGNQFDFCPIVLDKDTIRVDLRARISQLDNKHSVRINGSNVPAIHLMMSLDTALQIKSGYVAVLSGLTQRRAIEKSENTSEANIIGKPTGNSTFAAQTPAKSSDEKQDQAKESYDEITTLVLIKAEVIKEQDK